MKLLAVAALAVLSTACTAQQAPVNIALDIYQSCLVGFTQARGFPTTLPDIRTQSIELDTICTQWTYAWLPPFIDKDKGSLNLAEDLRFKQRKASILAVYVEELRMLTSK